MNRLAVMLICCAALAGGCSHYEYDLVRPSDLAQHIGTKSDATIAVGPLEYRMIAYEDHLVLRVFNRTPADTIKLLGDQSTVVDPRGQSHSLRSQTIAAGSFVKLILPPTRTYIEPRGPVIGIGFGGFFSSGRGFHHGYYPDRYGYADEAFFWDEPRYYTVYDDAENAYWNWSGEGEVRLTLVFQRLVRPPATQPDAPPPGMSAETFSQEFMFRQRKM